MFEADDPWHRYLHLCFALHCERCHAEYGVSDASAAELDGDFLALCETLAARAQGLGWQAVGGWAFRCPACASAPDAPGTSLSDGGS